MVENTRAYQACLARYKVLVDPVATSVPDSYWRSWRRVWTDAVEIFGDRLGDSSVTLGQLLYDSVTTASKQRRLAWDRLTRDEKRGWESAGCQLTDPVAYYHDATGTTFEVDERRRTATLLRLHLLELLELRGLLGDDGTHQLNVVERLRIGECENPELMQRWLDRARTAATLAEVLDDPITHAVREVVARANELAS